MSGWTDTELSRIGPADELEIASYRQDGTLRPYTTIWVVRVGDELYVRSWRGRSGVWFRRALQRHEGRIRAAGVERDVTFEEPDDSVHPAIHEAYRSKYARYPDRYVRPMVEPDATAATFRLVPR
jgi:hypothetical protein